MTTRTKETLEERAARVQGEMAELYAEQNRQQRANAEKLAQHQRAVDAEAVAAYDRKALDAEVEKARQAVVQAVVDHPLTKALSRYYIAGARRRELFDQRIGALGRQGRDITGVRHPETMPIDVIGLMVNTAANAGTDARLELEADFHTRRDTIPEENEK